MEYKSVNFEEHSQGLSIHTLSDLDEILNKHAQDGWKLSQMKKSTIGFILVFERSHE